MRATGLSMIVLLLLSCISGAQVIHIPENFQNIQEGINHSADMDTILVAEGRYYENINFHGKAITVASMFLVDGDTSHISRTIIDGSRPSHPDTASTVLMISGEDSASVLSGFTITGGTGTITTVEYPKSLAGGGILIQNSGGSVISNMITRNHINSSDRAVYGGGLFASADNTDRTIILADNFIAYNRIVSGVMVDGAGITAVSGRSGRIVIRNNLIYQNEARSTIYPNAHGGGLSLVYTTPYHSKSELSGNVIRGNKLYGSGTRIYGAGLHLLGIEEEGNFIDLNPSPYVNNNEISGNYSANFGGGIACIYISSGPSPSVISPRPILIGNEVSDNRAKNGAGICVLGGIPLMIGNVFRNNLSDDNNPEFLITDEGRIFAPGTDFKDTRNIQRIFGWKGRYFMRSEKSYLKLVRDNTGESMAFRILPPAWRQWWAFIVYAILLVAIFLLYRKYLLHRITLKTALETERIEREKIVELDRMKSRFFANISHEFRTPLTLILGPIEDLLKKKPAGEEHDRDILRTMRSNAMRLQRLINQLLDLSKIETGKMKLQVSPGDLTEYIKRIFQSFISLAESRKINYMSDLAETSQPVYFDEDIVEKIVINLISNAFKFTPEERQVKVTLKYLTENENDNPDKFSLSVRDTGKGIPKDQIRKIFDRFYQISSADAKEEQGTGIGLSLVRDLTQLYRGEIQVESEPGKGSVFTVHLPAAKDFFQADEIVPVRMKEYDVSESDDTYTGISEVLNIDFQDENITEHGEDIVLVVEDNLDLRKYIATNLYPSFRVIEAENGKQGLEEAVESLPDLVISDLMMPEMDGVEMCRSLKSDERTCHIPVIMLTARADRDSKIEGLETGAEDYIIKPFDAEELQLKVNNIVAHRKKLRDKFSNDFLMGPDDKIYQDSDDILLNRIMTCYMNHIDDPGYTIEMMLMELGLSRTQLFRKTHALTNQSPSELLRNTRLEKAARLLQHSNQNVAQVMYSVGFNNPSYFAECFRKRFRVNPSDYIKQNR